MLLRPAGESCGGPQRIGIQQFTVQHYYPRLPQIGESRRRVAFDEDKVGGVAAAANRARRIRRKKQGLRSEVIRVVKKMKAYAAK